jgi:hypothetical protein
MAAPLVTSKSTIDELASLVPFALAFLADAGDGSTYSVAKNQLREWVERDPFDSLVAAVIGGGYAYYLAERDSNDHCNTPLDGILYASSALFGYDTALPTTEHGRAVASFVKTFGPALASNAFSPTAAEKRATDDAERLRVAQAAEVDRQILARLEDIVRLLERQKT